MKVYFSVNDLYKQPNPYTWTLADGMKKIEPGLEILWNTNIFWTEEIFSCDIIHIHWPEQLLMFGKYTSAELKKRLIELKHRKIIIVATCHNLKSHNTKNNEYTKAYSVVYDLADMVFHLGDYSKSIFEQLYPHTLHKLIMHHVYDAIYLNRVSKDEALEYLHLNKCYRYILCFGQFRNNEERKLVINAYHKLKNDRIRIIAPAFSPVDFKRRNPILKIMSIYQYLKYSILYPGIVKKITRVSDDELPYFYAAADICLIHRTNILNSGNLPLAFYMGKIAVGPDIGNIGQLLRNTGNPFFAPNNDGSIIKALESALKMPGIKGELNKQWVEERCLTGMICKEILDSYKFIINDKRNQWNLSQ